MITQETAGKIWTCYREIEASKKLLTDLTKDDERTREDKDLPTLRDAFGRRRHLQLGVPSGENAHRLFDVRPDLALCVIRAHIAEQEAEMVRLNEAARIEVDTPMADGR